MKNHWKISVRGNKVQRVHFRVTAKAVADQLGVKGIVLNQADGSLYIEAEGDAFALESLVDFCKEGPDGAEVSSVDIDKSAELQNYKNFEVVKRKSL